MDARRALIALLVTLAGGLTANALLGPLLLGVIDYRWSETINNQGIGLDAVALVAVVPLCLVAAWLVNRGRTAGAALALGPAAFALYMMPQYVIGPEYLAEPGNNERFFALHYALFAVAGGVFLLAWNAVRSDELPALSPTRRRGAIAFLFVFPFFLIFGIYLKSFADAVSETPARAEYIENPTPFWVISFLDLAIAAPAAAVSGWGLFRRFGWASKALYALVGWFALVPPSIAVMSLVMLAKDDPGGSAGGAISFTAFAVVFATFAAWLYLPLLRPDRPVGVGV